VNIVVNLLEKLKSMKIRNLPQRGRMTKVLFDLGKGHLVYLMPVFIECIETREMELRDSIKDILSEISTSIVHKE